MIDTLAWVLPRPRECKYPGGFPLHFEKRLLRLYDWPSSILHVFGGMGEYGLRLDIKRDVSPDVVGDAHRLPFRAGSFDMVICDPPYSNELAARMYGTGKLIYKHWSSEAVRVCKPGGHIVMYHERMVPRAKGTAYQRRILLATRVWHHLRYVGIFQKDSV